MKKIDKVFKELGELYELQRQIARSRLRPRTQTSVREPAAAFEQSRKEPTASSLDSRKKLD